MQKITTEPVLKPVLRERYGISWAGAQYSFILVLKVGDTCYLDNPVNKRKKQGKDLIKCKISELREQKPKSWTKN